MDIDEDAEENFVNSPLVLTTEVCNPVKCRAGKMEGVCISGESCFKHGGQIGNPCSGSRNLICCTCQYIYVDVIFNLYFFSILSSVNSYSIADIIYTEKNMNN